MLRMHRTIGVLAAALAALLIVGGALAQHDPPHRLFGFDGDVTIDGQNAAAGTELAAMAYGRVVGSTTVGTDGSWALDVPGGLEDVSIVVAGIETDGGYNTTRGGSTRVMRAVMTPVPEESDTTGAEAEEPADKGGDLEGDGDLMGADEDPAEEPAGEDGEAEEPAEDVGQMVVEFIDEEPPADDSTSMDDGDQVGDGGDAMDTEGSDMMDDGDATANGFPGTGTGGLADRSSAAGPVYGGLAATLALFALLVGLAVRRHARSSVRA